MKPSKISGRIALAAAAIAVAAFATACGSDGSTSGNDTGWGPGNDTGGDAAMADGNGADSQVDARPPPSDTTVEPDTTAPGDSTTERGPGLTEGEITKQPWYGMFRLAEMPAVSGTMQELELKADKSVSISGGAVTGKWRIFDDDTVLLYELKDSNGMANNPEEIPLDADLENGWLLGFDVFVPEGPSGDPYEIRYEPLGTSDFDYDALTGDWQSKKKYMGQMGGEYRILLRIEQSGEIGYGVFTGTYTEIARGNGELITYEDGKSYWFIMPSSGGGSEQMLGGEIRRNSSGNAVMYGLRGINNDGMPGPDEFETVELEPVDSPSL